MNNDTTIKFNDEECSLTYKCTKETYPSKQKHTIVHITNPFDPEDIKGSGITRRPAYSRKGDDKELDKEWRKYNKFEISLEKQIIMHAVSQGMLDANLASELKWSRTAGCSCGCSPGWKSRDYRRQTIWLKLISPSKEQEKKERNRDMQAKWEQETLSSMVI